jgi:dTDP-4-amino-4,6-dideoxygalactose transaminase
MTQESAVSFPRAALGTVLGEEEIAAVAEVIRAGTGLSHGRWRREFEATLAAWLGVRHAVTVTSGTVALAIATTLLDLEPGDEVIATPQTYQATVQALLGTEVRVRFCDIDDNSLNIAVDRLTELLTPRTRAIFLVHYGGFPAPMAEIMRLARARGIIVVEDCAHTLGTQLDGGRPGSLADIGCFSFQSSKAISTLGEGGLITFSRDDWIERVTRIRDNDCDAVYVPAPSGIPEVERALYPGHAHTHDCVRVRHPGTNATMGEPAAAVGLAQLRRLPALLARRREIAAAYDEHLAHVTGIRRQVVPPGVVLSHHFYTCFVEPELGVERDTLVRALQDAGVEMWQRYFPLHLLPEWRARGSALGDCPVAERMWFGSQLNLPCYPAMTDENVARICATLDRAMALATR